MTALVRTERIEQTILLIRGQRVVRAFVRLRELALTHHDLLAKINAMERKYDSQFRVVFDARRIGRSCLFGPTIHKFLGPCDLLSYLVMMTPRLQEMRRVMKTGGVIPH